MNNIFLFDIDGTLSINGIIPKSTIDTIKLLRENNDIVMLSTGRCLGQMKDVMSILEVDGAILNNGAYTYINDELIFESKINKNVIIEMLNDNIEVSILTHDDFIRFPNSTVYSSFVKHFNIEEPRLEDLSYLDNHNVYSLGIYSYDLDSIDISKYKELRFVKVCPLGYDAMNKDITKASPIKELKMRYPKYKIIAFGDNYNDIEMLEASDISIVMKHAPDDVKKYADFITLDVLEDGIKYAFENYLKRLL